MDLREPTTQLVAALSERMAAVPSQVVFNALANLAAQLAYQAHGSDLESGCRVIQAIAAAAETALAINIQGLPANEG